MSDLQTRHDRDIALIAEKVKEFYKNQKPFRIYHGTTGSTRPMAFKAGTFIDTQKLNRIFPVNKEKMTMKVEPKVAMDELVAAAQKEGFLPQVVPELMGITAGGAFSGTAGESSSYIHGLFEETVAEIEIIVGDGTILKASANENAELWEGACSSMGTLGIITLLEVKLVPAKKYVQLDLRRANGIVDAMAKMELAIKDPQYEYVDGMLFEKDYGVVMFGKLTDKPDNGAEVRSFVKRNEPWFSNYIEKVGADRTKDPKPIALPVDQYFFRYDRGVFWGGKLAFDYFHVPFNRVTRWMLDPLMGSRVAYHGLHEGGFANKYIVQDFDMPESKAGPFVEYISTILPNYQFWLCPAKTGNDLKVMHKLLPPGGDQEKHRIMREERIYNVGVYGKGTKDHDKFVKLNREIEHKLWHDFCGVKILYAHAYYTEEEFWQIYNKAIYDEVRKKYNSETLPTVYDKISQDMQSGRREPKHLGGTIGAIRAFLGLLSHKRRTNYLLDKRGGSASAAAAKQSSAPTAKSVDEKPVNGVNGDLEKQAHGSSTTDGFDARAFAAQHVTSPHLKASMAASAPNGAAKDASSDVETAVDQTPTPESKDHAPAISAPTPTTEAARIPLPHTVTDEKLESTALSGASAIEKPVQASSTASDPIAAADDLFDRAVSAKETRPNGIVKA
ncbi:Delta(24)-sterol [Cyphellophora attinorum]|uniref:Delta(24)-sterol reductase n=1 Tax=Cyphellophora attinorum TaxID=1664694 RepID=A0A0N1NXL5_9EURO|nr:Delta(24)-sterol [Phialophora attinorum]KPI38712.1 Delta(24)-sterol [Phialophora attinorum]